MMRVLLFIVLMLSVVPPASAAECSAAVQLDDVGVLQFDNRSKACSVWSVAIFSRGFATFQFTIETAPDAGGTPGAWSAVSNLLTGPRGTLPATEADGVNQAYSFSIYAPWIRVNLEAVTGAGVWRATLKGNLETERSGLPLVGPVGCNSTAFVMAAAATPTQLLTGVAGKRLYICRVGITNTTAPGSVTVYYGTGAVCATGLTYILPFASFAAAGVPFFPGASRPVWTIPAGQNLCFAPSAGPAGLWVHYIIW